MKGSQHTLTDNEMKATRGGYDELYSGTCGVLVNGEAMCNAKQLKLRC